MTVWIVTTGVYSDYRIVAVFSSEEKAREMVPNNDPKSSWGYDVWEVDVPCASFVQPVYAAWVDLATGEAHEWTTRSDLRDKYWSSGQWHTHFDRCWGFSVVSQGHAHKVAVETRQAALRGVETTLSGIPEEAKS